MLSDDDDHDDDDELFLRYGWPTKDVALFPAGTIIKDPHHRESPTRVWEHSWWSFLAKTVNNIWPLNIFAKALHRRSSTGF